MKKLISIVLIFILIFSFCVPVYSAEIDGFYSNSMTVSGKGEYVSSDGKFLYDDLTSSITVSQGTYSGKSCTNYIIPINNDYIFRFVSAFHFENLNSSHEYNLKFAASSSIANVTLFGVYLVFYNSNGIVLREQELYASDSVGLTWQNVDVDFKPDTTGLGGYKTKIEFRFVTTTSSLIYFRLSDVIELTDKDDNSSWFQKIINAIKEIPENLSNLKDTLTNSFTSLGDRISGFFSSLGDKITTLGDNISGFFTALGDRISGFFTSLGDRISGFFTSLGDRISGFFINLRDNLLDKLNTIKNEFTERFEKFKPRIYEDLNWQVGMVNGINGVVTNKPTVIANRRAVTTSLFYVPSGTKFVFEQGNLDGTFTHFAVYKYDSSGNFIGTYIVSNDLDNFPGVNYVDNKLYLDSNYSYRFSVFSNTDINNTSNSELTEYINTMFYLYADEGWLSAFGNSLLSGLKSLFIPKDNYFNDKLLELQTFFDSKFGVFALPFTLIVSVLDLYNNVGNGSGILHLNEFSIANNVFLQSRDINLKQLILDFSQELYNNSGIDLYDIYLAFIDVIILFAFVRLIKHKYDKMINNGSFDMPKDIMNDKGSASNVDGGGYKN